MSSLCQHPNGIARLRHARAALEHIREIAEKGGLRPMCLIVLANDVGAHVLAIAANRDEDHARPSLPAHFWADAPGVYGGRDVVAGGTWLGVSTRGRLAAVTNVRSTRSSRGRISRGALCRAFLIGDEAALPYSMAVLGHRAEYGAFNLLVHDGRSLYYVSHTIEAPVAVARGVHGISNAALNEPWPKVERSKRALSEALDAAPKDLVEAMFTLLASRERAADGQLPDTGYGVDVERELSPPFIASQSHGTRCSTVVLWDRDGRVTFEERSFGPGGVPAGIVRQEFSALTENAPHAGRS
ncbi:MAG TPA: NRDE family protein [Polyangiaceae bacterium]|nr:NRDE family protein [Polyangiaceae bacterium]